MKSSLATRKRFWTAVVASNVLVGSIAPGALAQVPDAVTSPSGQMANSPPSGPMQPPRQPWLAASLGPVGTFGLLWAQSFPAVAVAVPNLAGAPMATLPLIAPAAFGLGHLYVGDYPKAAAIAVGAPLVSFGVGMAAGHLRDALDPCDLYTCSPTGPDFFTGWALTGLAIGIWASWDAYHAAALSSEPMSRELP